MRKYSFPAIVDKNSTILILGTMPSEKSLQLNEYYANPMNQFWKILSFVTGDNFFTTYSEKKELLLKNKIAIWDVLMHCEREGSLDLNIHDEFPNDFIKFFNVYPNIRSVYFNGSKAEKLFGKYSLHVGGRTHILLPSTSSANTSKSLSQKSIVWKEKIISVNTKNDNLELKNE